MSRQKLKNLGNSEKTIRILLLRVTFRMSNHHIITISQPGSPRPQANRQLREDHYNTIQQNHEEDQKYQWAT